MFRNLPKVRAKGSVQRHYPPDLSAFPATASASSRSRGPDSGTTYLSTRGCSGHLGRGGSSLDTGTMKNLHRQQDRHSEACSQCETTEGTPHEGRQKDRPGNVEELDPDPLPLFLKLHHQSLMLFSSLQSPLFSGHCRAAWLQDKVRLF